MNAVLFSVRLFSSEQARSSLSSRRRQVSANPADVNILPGYGGDPRTIDKLFDGVSSLIFLS
jgi:hypothetical protein